MRIRRILHLKSASDGCASWLATSDRWPLCKCSSKSQKSVSGWECLVQRSTVSLSAPARRPTTVLTSSPTAAHNSRMSSTTAQHNADLLNKRVHIRTLLFTADSQLVTPHVARGAAAALISCNRASYILYSLPKQHIVDIVNHSITIS